MRKVLFFLPAISAACFVACSSGQGDGDPLDIESASRALAEAQCSYYQRCEPAFMSIFRTDMNGCISMQQADWKTRFQDMSPALDANRIHFVQSKLDACVGELNSVDCELGQDDNSACNDVLMGVQSEGAPCAVTAECGPDHYCARPDGLGACGTCQRSAQRGQSCGNIPCARGSDCRDVGSPSEPNPICVPDDAAENAACLTPDTGLCRGALRCVGQEAPGVCQRPAAAGATCDENDLSAPNCNIFANQKCVTDTCQTVSWSSLGGPCGGAKECDDQSYCPMGASSCQQLPAAGQSCADTGVCRNGAYCDETGMCGAVKSAGAPCINGQECQDSLVCVGPPGAGMCGTFTWMKCE